MCAPLAGRSCSRLKPVDWYHKASPGTYLLGRVDRPPWWAGLPLPPSQQAGRPSYNRKFPRLGIEGPCFRGPSRTVCKIIMDPLVIGVGHQRHQLLEPDFALPP